uniref:Uncharacterized protein n=1 Tax=Knipowitschia caucasica TaxID=637954 RepID=A0AAV2KJ01_KNICA
MRRGKKGGMRRKTPADRPVDQESSNKSRVRRVQTKAKARRKKLVKKTPHVPCVKQDSNSNTSGCEQETSPIPEKQESSPAPIPDLDCLPGSSSLPLCDPEKLQRIMRRGKKGGMRRKTPADRPVDQESSNKSRVRRVQTKAKARRKKLVKKTPHVPCVKQDSNSNTSGCEQETSPIPEKQDSSPAPIPDLDCLPGSSSLPLCDPEKLQRIMRRGKKGGMRRKTPADRPVDQESSNKSRVRRVQTKAKARRKKLVQKTPHVPCVKQDSNSNTSGCEQETSPIPEKQESSPAPIPDLDCLPGSSSLPLCDPEKLQRIMRRGKKGRMRRKTPADRPVDQESSNKSRVRRVQTKAKASSSISYSRHRMFQIVPTHELWIKAAVTHVGLVRHRHRVDRLLTGSSPAPHRLLTGSSPAPHQLLTGSSLAPHLLLTSSSPAPHRLLTCSSPAPHLLLTSSSPAPHRLLTGSSPAPHLLLTSSSPAPHQLLTSSSPAPHRLLTCSSPAPHLLLTGSSLAPHLLLTSSSPAPHWLLTCSSPAPHLLLTSSSPAPHQLLTGSSPAPHLLLTSSSPAPHQLLTGSSLAPHRLLTGFSLAPHRLLTCSSPAPHQLLTSSSPAPHSPCIPPPQAARSIFSLSPEAGKSE